MKITRVDDEIHIYYNNSLICTHAISERPINYQTEHYVDGLKDSIRKETEESEESYEDRIRRKAEESLARMKQLTGKVK